MKLKRKKLPLRVYLAAGFLIFSFLLLIVLWVFQTVFLEPFYKSVKTGQVKNCVNSVVENIDSSDLNDLIADIEEQNNMSVAIYNTDSKFFEPVYLTRNRPQSHTQVNMEIAYGLYDKAKENGGEYSTVTQAEFEQRFNPRQMNDELPTNSEDSSAAPDRSNGMGDKNDNADRGNYAEKLSLDRRNVQNLAYARIVSTSSGERLVIVESEITPVASVVDTLRYQLIIITIVIVVLSIIVSIIVANMISKPISDTNKKAKSLAKQNYDLRLSGGKYREIKELNDTLTYAAQELEKVDSLQKELIANISHDLRTPLTMITGYAEVMRDLPGEVTPENIQIIIDEANRLNNLVCDLLDISRLRSGTADMKMLPFSLTDCIKSIFSRYQKLVENDGLNIVFEHDGEVFVKGDELRMTQVLYNLVNNAVNYIGDDKTVIVRQTVADGSVRIDVIDHGEGIPEEKLEYIWDRYYRVDKEHRRSVIGTGLGLSIVKNILIAHDADFGVASKVGSGSDFYFSLPVISPEKE